VRRWNRRIFRFAPKKHFGSCSHTQVRAVRLQSEIGYSSTTTTAYQGAVFLASLNADPRAGTQDDRQGVRKNLKGTRLRACALPTSARGTEEGGCRGRAQTPQETGKTPGDARQSTNGPTGGVAVGSWLHLSPIPSTEELACARPQRVRPVAGPTKARTISHRQQPRCKKPRRRLRRVEPSRQVAEQRSHEKPPPRKELTSLRRASDTMTSE
jgi:hypothetical protein